MIAKDKIQVGSLFLSQTPQWAPYSNVAQECQGETDSLRTRKTKQVWPFSSLGSVPPLSGRPAALGTPPAPVTPLQPYGGGILASVPQAEAAAGLCHGNGSCLMKTLQDGQGINKAKQSHWCVGRCKQKRTKKYLSMQRWIAETWDIVIAWERGIVRSKAVIRQRWFPHDSESDSHTCRADTPHMPISLI